MFTLLTTWIGERIITVTAVSVITVAAVPTTLVIVKHDDGHQQPVAVAVIQPADDHQKVVLVAAVKKAGDAVIAKLNTAENTCGTTVTNVVNTSKVAAKVQPALTTARGQIHGTVSPFVAAIVKDEDRFAHLKVVTPQDEETELHEISLIELTAIGDGKSSGTITVTCQTVLITIQETIQVTVIQETPAPVPVCKSDHETD